MPGFAAAGSTTTGRRRPFGVYAWQHNLDDEDPCLYGVPGYSPRPYGATWADIDRLSDDEDPALYDVPGYS